jgi:hypothetical protein
MYLRAERYVGSIDYTREDNSFTRVDNPEYAILQGLMPEGADEFADYGSIRVNIGIGYWRKVNQIHGWFVDNLAKGEDDCKPIYVPDSKLRELRAIVQHLLEVKDNKPDEVEAQIQEHLPLADGLFFGSREIDEWYWQGLEMTVPILDKAIDLAENHELSIYYEASW